MSENSIPTTTQIGLKMEDEKNPGVEVPVFIYDPSGMRHAIGTATVVVREDGGWDLSGEITDPDARVLLCPDPGDYSLKGNPDDWAVGFREVPCEVVYAPEPAKPAPQPNRATRRRRHRNKGR